MLSGRPEPLFLGFLLDLPFLYLLLPDGEAPSCSFATIRENVPQKMTRPLVLVAR